MAPWWSRRSSSSPATATTGSTSREALRSSRGTGTRSARSASLAREGRRTSRAESRDGHRAPQAPRAGDRPRNFAAVAHEFAEHLSPARRQCASDARARSSCEPFARPRLAAPRAWSFGRAPRPPRAGPAGSRARARALQRRQEQRRAASRRSRAHCTAQRHAQLRLPALGAVLVLFVSSTAYAQLHWDASVHGGASERILTSVGNAPAGVALPG